MTIANPDVLSSFLEEAGYGEDDVLAFNPESREIVTRNGGVYRLSVTGKILHIKGPSPDPTERL